MHTEEIPQDHEMYAQGKRQVMIYRFLLKTGEDTDREQQRQTDQKRRTP